MNLKLKNERKKIQDDLGYEAIGINGADFVL